MHEATRAAPAQIHVRGYQEEGAIITTFDMVAMNDMDRFHLVMTSSTGCPAWRPGRLAAPADGRPPGQAPGLTREHGEDLPEVRDWIWPRDGPESGARAHERNCLVHRGPTAFQSSSQLVSRGSTAAPRRAGR